jgi:hypothetical protein
MENRAELRAGQELNHHVRLLKEKTSYYNSKRQVESETCLLLY